MVEGLPSVVIYKVNRFDLWIARPFIKAKYISLVNLLADAEVFPEYLTSRDVSGAMVRWALAWLDDSPERDRAVEAIKALRHRVAQPGASGRAADHIVGWLKRHRRYTPMAAAGEAAGPRRPGQRTMAYDEAGPSPR
jgi:lipid-A-disaccharide synthase